MTDPSSEATASNDTAGGLAGWLQVAAIISVIVVAFGITAVLAASSGNGPAPAPERPATPVRVIIPETGDHAVTVSITGAVAAPALVALSPQVGGRIIDLSPAVRAGGAFSAGDVLFTIDPRDYEVAVQRAEASLADARSTLDQLDAEAAINIAEWERQYPGRDISPLAAREPQLEAARARVEAAAADLAQARLNLERTEIRFPFDGRVVDSRVEAGQLAIAGQSYGSVYDSEALEIVAPIAPADLARLNGAENRTAQVTFEGARAPFAAQVARVGAQLDERTRFIDLFLTAPPEVKMQPGLFAEVRLRGPVLEDVMILPAAAAPGLDQVRIVRSGVIEERRIEVLDRPRGQVVVRPFDYADGVIVSPLPEGAVGRPAEIVTTPGPAT